MAQQTISPPQHGESNDLTGKAVSAEEYMQHYAGERYEWVKGVLIKMPPSTLIHNRIGKFLLLLLDAYFSLTQLGQVIGEFVMEVEETESKRLPELQIILNTSQGQLADTSVIGPADICIEIVSPGSVVRDYGEKFVEYEKGGIKEYWIADPIRKAARFNRLNERGIYEDFPPDENGDYTTPLLPGFRLHVPTLWQDELPNFYEIGEAVKAMLGR